MDTSIIAQIAYLVSAILFVSGIKQLSSPATARSGNARASVAMLLAIVVTLIDNQILDWTSVAGAVIAGAVIGGVLARKIEMTAMPELVAIFNGFGGGASAAVAAAEFVRVEGSGGGVALGAGVTIVLSTLIGAVTFPEPHRLRQARGIVPASRHFAQKVSPRLSWRCGTGRGVADVGSVTRSLRLGSGDRIGVPFFLALVRAR